MDGLTVHVKAIMNDYQFQNGDQPPLEELRKQSMAAGMMLAAQEQQQQQQQPQPSQMNQLANKRPTAKKPDVERAPRSLFMFTLDNQFRKWCISFAEWKPFEYFILVTILTTCVSLALSTPYPNGDSDELNALLVIIKS